LPGSLLNRLLNKEKLKGTVGKKKNESNMFTFHDIGRIIEQLTNFFYAHKFTQLPYSKMDRANCNKLLNDTVRQTHFFFELLIIS
jgi:hypothetical protein